MEELVSRGSGVKCDQNTQLIILIILGAPGQYSSITKTRKTYVNMASLGISQALSIIYDTFFHAMIAADFSRPLHTSRRIPPYVRRLKPPKPPSALAAAVVVVATTTTTGRGGKASPEAKRCPDDT